MFIEYLKPEKVNPEIISRNKEICKRVFKGETFTKIADSYGLSRERVRQIVKKRSGITAKDVDDIRKKTKDVKVYYFKCNFCKKEFYTRNMYGRKFCSAKCRTSFFLKNMVVDKAERINSLNGRIRPPKKYRNIYNGMSKDKKGRSTYRSEHRVVMEKYLGRKLKTWEHVHHIDGNGLNNSIENLQLIRDGDHSKLTIKKSLIPVFKMTKINFVKSKFIKNKDLTLHG